jgi:hypothetical protein
VTVSIDRTAEATTLTWTRDDDPQGYIVQAVDNGRLEAALTALGLKDYADLADLPEAERAELLRHTAALTAELARRVRHLTVAHRHHGASWAELASLLVDDPDARSTARSTYQAGLRQMGRATTDADTTDA